MYYSSSCYGTFHLPPVRGRVPLTVGDTLNTLGKLGVSNANDKHKQIQLQAAEVCTLLPYVTTVCMLLLKAN